MWEEPPDREGSRRGAGDWGRVFCCAASRMHGWPSGCTVRNRGQGGGGEERLVVGGLGRGASGQALPKARAASKSCPAIPRTRGTAAASDQSDESAGRYTSDVRWPESGDITLLTRGELAEARPPGVADGPPSSAPIAGPPASTDDRQRNRTHTANRELVRPGPPPAPSAPTEPPSGLPDRLRLLSRPLERPGRPGSRSSDRHTAATSPRGHAEMGRQPQAVASCNCSDGIDWHSMTPDGILRHAPKVYCPLPPVGEGLSGSRRGRTQPNATTRRSSAASRARRTTAAGTSRATSVCAGSPLRFATV